MKIIITSDALRKHNEFKIYNKITKNVGQEVLDEINPEVLKIATDRANEKRKKARQNSRQLSNC